LNAVRDPDLTPNSTTLITDYILDADGQITEREALGVRAPLNLRFD